MREKIYKKYKVIEKYLAWVFFFSLLFVIVIISVPGLSGWAIKKTGIQPHELFLPLFGLLLMVVFRLTVSFQKSLEKFEEKFNQDVNEIKSKIELDKYFNKINSEKEASQFIKKIVSQMTPRSDKYFLFSDAITNLSTELQNTLLSSSEIAFGNVKIIMNLTNNNSSFIDAFLTRYKSSIVKATSLEDTGNVIIIGCDDGNRKDILVIQHENISEKIFGFYTNLSELANSYIEMLKGLSFQKGSTSIPAVEIDHGEIKNLILKARERFIKSLEDASKGYYTIPTREKLYEELAGLSTEAQEVKIIDVINIEDWGKSILDDNLLPHVEVQKERCKLGDLILERIHVISKDEEKNISNNFSNYELLARFHEQNKMNLKFISHIDCPDTLDNFGCVIIDKNTVITDKSPKTLDEFALISYNKKTIGEYKLKYQSLGKKTKTIEQIKQKYINLQ